MESYSTIALLVWQNSNVHNLSDHVAPETRLVPCSCLCTSLVWRFCLEFCSALPGLIAVSWLLIRPQPVQEPLFQCELASVNCHCGGACNFSLFFTSSSLWVVFQWVHSLSSRGSGTCQLEHSNTISSDYRQFFEALSQSVDGPAKCWNFVFLAPPIVFGYILRSCLT